MNSRALRVVLVGVCASTATGAESERAPASQASPLAMESIVTAATRLEFGSAWAEAALPSLSQPKSGSVGEGSTDAATASDAQQLQPVEGAADAGTAAPDGAPAGANDLAKRLQNPVADLISVPFQLNYDDGFGPKEAGRFTLNIQPVIPIGLNDDWNLISRTIIPIVYQESLADGLDSDFGLGDVLQSAFFSPKEPVGGWILGAGPVALLPTGTDPQLRSEQFAIGPTIVALRQSHGWTYGALANHLWSVTDSDDHDTINSTFVQPFVSYTWPSATTLALNAEATYDWTRDELTLPLNLLVSQLVVLSGQPVQFTVGGRYYADAPAGGPEWGLRFTFTLLFPK